MANQFWYFINFIMSASQKKKEKVMITESENKISINCFTFI